MARTLAGLILLAAAPLAAQDLPPDRWHAPVPRTAVGDNDGVRCAWLCLEALANRAGHPALAARAGKRPGPLFDPNEIAKACRADGVECDLIRDRDGLAAFLTKHVTEGRRPCAIGVYDATHVVLCTHFEAGVRVGTVGNGRGSGEPRMWTWDEFRTVLRPDGLAYALPDDGRFKANKVPAAQPAPAGPHPAAVRIENSDAAQKTQGGSGVVVKSGGGTSLILTNRHVIDPPGRLYAHVPSRNYFAKARVVRLDPVYDLAVLEVPGDLPVAELAPEAPAKDDPLTLWGFPGGVQEPQRKDGRAVGFRGTMNGPWAKDAPVYETTVRPDHGDSGGAMYDSLGRVVCLVSTNGSCVGLPALAAAVGGKVKGKAVGARPEKAEPAKGPLREQPK